MQEEEEKHKLSSDTTLYFLQQSISQSDQSIKSENELTNITQFTYLVQFYFVFHHLSSILLFIWWKVHFKCSRIWVTEESFLRFLTPSRVAPFKNKIKSSKSASGRREAQIIIRHNIVLLTPKYLTVWSKHKIWDGINKYDTIYLFTSILFRFPSFIFYFIIHS